MSGVMEEAMKVNTLKIESMVLVYINGQMEEFTRVIGILVNRMAMENILLEMEHLK